MKSEFDEPGAEHHALKNLSETPITRVDTLHVAQTRELQPPRRSPLFIKRDDLKPRFGNKTRQLELILADARSQGADCVITAGGPQSNHCRQTAQFARALGVEAHLMFGTATGEKDFPCIGNQVVNRLFGAEIHTAVHPYRGLHDRLAGTRVVRR